MNRRTASRSPAPVVGEMERLLAVERELETVLREAREKADALSLEAEEERATTERGRAALLELELEARKRELYQAATAEMDRLTSDAAAHSESYDRIEAGRLDAIARRVAALVAGGDVP